MVSEGLQFVSAIDRQDKNESDMLSPEKILLSSKYDEHRYISQAGKHFHQTTLYQNKLVKENFNFMRMITSHGNRQNLNTNLKVFICIFYNQNYKRIFSPSWEAKELNERNLIHPILIERENQIMPPNMLNMS